MSTPLHFWYEFASPYSYLSGMRMEEVAKAKGVEVIWRPFLLGGIYKMLDLPIPPMQLNHMKESYMWMDCARQAARHGLQFNKPDTFPHSAVLSSRVALIGLEEGWGQDFSRRVYQANFVHNQLISDLAVISKILADIGQNVEEVMAKAVAPENKKALMDQTKLAFDKKIFGVPTFFVDDQMFWGDDRLEYALEVALNG